MYKITLLILIGLLLQACSKEKPNLVLKVDDAEKNRPLTAAVRRVEVGLLNSEGQLKTTRSFAVAGLSSSTSTQLEGIEWPDKGFWIANAYSEDGLVLLSGIKKIDQTYSKVEVLLTRDALFQNELDQTFQSFSFKEGTEILATQLRSLAKSNQCYEVLFEVTPQEGRLPSVAVKQNKKRAQVLFSMGQLDENGKLIYQLEHKNVDNPIELNTQLLGESFFKKPQSIIFQFYTEAYRDLRYEGCIKIKPYLIPSVLEQVEIKKSKTGFYLLHGGALQELVSKKQAYPIQLELFPYEDNFPIFRLKATNPAARLFLEAEVFDQDHKILVPSTKEELTLSKDGFSEIQLGHRFLGGALFGKKRYLKLNLYSKTSAKELLEGSFEFELTSHLSAVREITVEPAVTIQPTIHFSSEELQRNSSQCVQASADYFPYKELHATIRILAKKDTAQMKYTVSLKEQERTKDLVVNQTLPVREKQCAVKLDRNFNNGLFLEKSRTLIFKFYSTLYDNTFYEGCLEVNVQPQFKPPVLSHEPIAFDSSDDGRPLVRLRIQNENEIPLTVNVSGVARSGSGEEIPGLRNIYYRLDTDDQMPRHLRSHAQTTIEQILVVPPKSERGILVLGLEKNSEVEVMEGGVHGGRRIRQPVIHWCKVGIAYHWYIRGTFPNGKSFEQAYKTDCW